MDRNQIWQLIGLELKKAKKKHPSWPTHIVAKAGIVNEECGELIRACVNLKYEAKTPEDRIKWHEEIEKEAIQVAATAIRFLENLKQ